MLMGMSDAARKDAAIRITFPKDLVGSHALIEQLACTVDSQTGTIEQRKRPPVPSCWVGRGG